MPEIKINSVTMSYAKEKSLDSINAVIGEGSIFGLIGSNGSGKSTLLRTMCGIIKPASGEVLVGGEPVFENESVIFFCSAGQYPRRAFQGRVAEDIVPRVVVFRQETDTLAEPDVDAAPETSGETDAGRFSGTMFFESVNTGADCALRELEGAYVLLCQCDAGGESYREFYVTARVHDAGVKNCRCRRNEPAAAYTSCLSATYHMTDEILTVPRDIFDGSIDGAHTAGYLRALKRGSRGGRRAQSPSFVI